MISVELQTYSHSKIDSPLKILCIGWSVPSWLKERCFSLPVGVIYYSPIFPQKYKLAVQPFSELGGTEYGNLSIYILPSLLFGGARMRLRGIRGTMSYFIFPFNVHSAPFAANWNWEQPKNMLTSCFSCQSVRGG